eukprot:6967127-Prymnesium_polylepis.1
MRSAGGCSVGGTGRWWGLPRWCSGVTLGPVCTTCGDPDASRCEEALEPTPTGSSSAMAATTLEGVTRGDHSGVGIGTTRSRSTDPGVPWLRMSGWAGGAPLCTFSRRSGHGAIRHATC